jgi:excisionase family DNA binding protein
MENEKLIETITKIVNDAIRGARSNDYLTVEEAAAFSKFSKGSLYNYISEGRIPHIKVEGKILFKKERLIEWIEKGVHEPMHTTKYTYSQHGGTQVRVRNY